MKGHIMYRNYFKSFFDYFFASLGILILSPVFLVVIIFLKLSSKDPVFFIHPRIGKDEKIIGAIKFRTMNNAKDSNGNLLPNIRRITPLGAVLRKFSIDELPQLFNVCLGEMSLIGPRPLEIRYMEFYTKDQSRRHEVKPGITGWAQINGRNIISWEERFSLDVWYVDNLSFWLDIKIGILTVKKVISREGINADSDNTVVPFDVYMKDKTKRGDINIKQ